MTHWAPDIQGWSYESDGSLTITWAQTTFFEDSPPDDVKLLLNGAQYKPTEHLSPNDHKTIPPADLAHYSGLLNVEVEFDWGNDPYFSPISIPLPVSSTGQGTTTEQPPILKVESVEPKSLQRLNRIGIHWQSRFGFTEGGGKGSWGPSAQPNLYTFDVKPGPGPSYDGHFATDTERALAPNTLYSFTVAVVNSLTGSSVWRPSTIVVRSARNGASLRQFLQVSGISLPSSIRASLGTGSLRATMGV